MSSLQHLHREWLSLRDTFNERIGRLETGETIYADSQYATNAWQNKLRVWRQELEDLIAQYPPTDLGAGHAVPSNVGCYPRETTGGTPFNNSSLGSAPTARELARENRTRG
jgi:hypothetical protein